MGWGCTHEPRIAYARDPASDRPPAVTPDLHRLFAEQTVAESATLKRCPAAFLNDFAVLADSFSA